MPAADPFEHGWATGDAAGVGVAGADAGAGLGVGVAPAADEAPAAGDEFVVVGVVVATLGDVVAAGATAGGGVAVGVADAGAADVTIEPAEVWGAPVAAAAGTVAAADPPAVVVVNPPPTSAEAEATTQRQASSTTRASTVTAHRRAPNPATVISVRGRIRSRFIRYPTGTVRVTVCRCPAPSSAANRRTSVLTLMPFSPRAGSRSLIRLCGWVICDSVR